MTNICMTVCNRFRLTEQAIRSLYAHTDRDAFSLTIVDDGSDDFRIARLLASVTATNYTYLYAHNSGHVLGRLKNLAVDWSVRRFGRGAWLYLSDNDVYFCDGWLTKLLDAAQETEADMFRVWGGQAHPYHNPAGHVSTQPISEHDCLAGTSMLMRWATWIMHGPFDANAAGVCQSEDYAFTERVKAKGGRIGVISPAVVIDTGITQTDGNASPGAELKVRVPGVLYE